MESAAPAGLASVRADLASVRADPAAGSADFAFHSVPKPSEAVRSYSSEYLPP